MVLAILAGSCTKAVDKAPSGRGGLPTGIVKTDEPMTGDESKLPLYPGAKRRATGSYETTDSMEKVVTYYSQQLGMQPKVEGEKLNTRAFDTPDFKLKIVPMIPESNGTEIHFYFPAKKPPK